ncbi:fibronectin type III domain-containing protein [Streptomyces tsukubensis]|uniref:fibronectin type III domain-containing protein n=1 Tax=Streptomyces tsukubensis TaxID=83656 RepID=UPI00344E8090
MGAVSGRMLRWVSFLLLAVAWCLAGAGPVGAVSDDAPPGANVRPVVTEVLPRDSAVDVLFIQGADSEPTGFTVTADPGGAFVRVGPDERSARVEGLANGTAYRFTVRQEYDGEPGWVLSEPSDPVTPQPAARPGAPVLDAVFGRDHAVEVEWTPGDDGGAAVTGYVVTADPGGARITLGEEARSAEITGLSNGTVHTIAVRAVNKAGQGDTAEETVTPGPDRVPGAPADVSAVPTGDEDTAVRVTWTTPEDDGGAAVTGYRITAGNRTVTAPGTAAEVVVDGLSPDGEYTVEVAAVNAVGTGPAAATEGPVSPKVDIAQDTVVLSAESLSRLAGDYPVDKRELRFTNPTDQLRALRRGDRIVAEATNPLLPGGLLRAVSDVRTRGSTLVVKTVDANLDEIIDDAQFSAGGELTAEGARTRVLHPGVRVKPITAEGELAFSLSVIPDPATPRFGFGLDSSVKGTVTLDPNWDLAIEMGWGGVSKMEFTADADVKASFTATVGGSATVIGKAVPLATTVFPPVTLNVGPIPVIVVPSLTISARLTFTGSLAVTVTAEYAQQAGGRITYTAPEDPDASGWSGETSTTEAEGQITADFAPSVSASLELPVALDFSLYGAVGPGLQVVPYLRLTATPLGNPWAQVDIGAQGEITGRIRKLDLEYVYPLYDASRTLWDTGAPFSGIYFDNPTRTVANGGSTDFEVRRVNWCGAGTITWELTPDSPGSIDRNGRYTADPGKPGSAVVTATQAPTGTCPETKTTAIVQSGPLIPSAPRNLSANFDGPDVVLTWDPPQDGGDTFTYHIQAFNGGVPWDYTSTTNEMRLTDWAEWTRAATVPDQYWVYAENSEGSGPWSESAELWP